MTSRGRHWRDNINVLHSCASCIQEGRETYKHEKERNRGYKKIQLSCPKMKNQFSSVTQLGLTLCDPVDCSTPGFPVHHQLPELAQVHARLPCPSPAPGACSSSCPSSRCCHPVISSSVVPSPPAFSFRVFPISQFFASGGQSIGVSALTSVLLMNTQDRSVLGIIGQCNLK